MQHDKYDTGKRSCFCQSFYTLTSARKTSQNLLQQQSSECACQFSSLQALAFSRISNLDARDMPYAIAFFTIVMIATVGARVAGLL
jgi:hypothetical protein